MSDNPRYRAGDVIQCARCGNDWASFRVDVESGAFATASILESLGPKPLVPGMSSECWHCGHPIQFDHLVIIRKMSVGSLCIEIWSGSGGLGMKFNRLPAFDEREKLRKMMTEFLAPEDERPKQTVLDEVRHEREQQDAKWGEQNHDPFKYLAILGEEVGEANQAAVDAYNWKENSWKVGTQRGLELVAYRQELIQVAAVAIAMVECLDRGKWNQT